MSRKANKLQIIKNRLALQNWGEALAKRVEGRARPIRKPKVAHSDLCAVYPMGDPHFGMYAWAEEAGDDFDLKIAERSTRAAIDDLFASTPSAHTALLISVGDLIHSDTKQNRTEASGHPLDVDTRWSRVMQVSLRMLVYWVEGALRKHRRVVVRLCEGNHDPQASYALALALSSYFRKERRVTVDLSPANFWYFRFGKVLIGATHGHTCKTEKLPSIMAADRPADWGATSFRVFFQGHLHHKFVKELWGCVVEVLRTLAAADAWAHGHGYRSGREMQAIVYHKQFGERVRHTWPIQMMESQRSSGRSRISNSRKAQSATKRAARSR